MNILEALVLLVLLVVFLFGKIKFFKTKALIKIIKVAIKRIFKHVNANASNILNIHRFFH